MLNVSYDFTVNDQVNGQVDYTSPNIEVKFICNGVKISFHPEILGKSDEWSNLIMAVENNTKYRICSEGTNSNYTIGYNDNKLNLSICAYGSGTVGELNVDIDLTEEIKQTLVGLEKLAKCIENKTEYKC